MIQLFIFNLHTTPENHNVLVSFTEAINTSLVINWSHQKGVEIIPAARQHRHWRHSIHMFITRSIDNVKSLIESEVWMTRPFDA